MHYSDLKSRYHEGYHQIKIIDSYTLSWYHACSKMCKCNWVNWTDDKSHYYNDFLLPVAKYYPRDPLFTI